MSDVQTLQRPDGETLAYKAIEGDGPTIIWIGAVSYTHLTLPTIYSV